MGDKICGAPPTNLTTTAQMNQPWNNGVGGLLSGGKTFFTIEQLMSNQVDSLVTQRINALVQANVIPKRPSMNQNDNVFNENLVQGNLNGAPDQVNPAQRYAEQMRRFQDSVKSEYCWYHQRYIAAVNVFLQQMVKDPKASNVGSLRQNALNLNARVNTLIVLMFGISKQRYGDVETMTKGINFLNQDLAQIATDLRKQAAILKKESNATQINARMVEFTKEKNEATQNLLSFYFVLNVVAITSLFVLARNL